MSQNKYILTAIGPTSKLAGVQDDSVRLEELDGSSPVSYGRVTPDTFKQLGINHRYKWTQEYINYGVLPTSVASFMFHWSPFADTGLVDASGISMTCTMGVVPVSATAGTSAGGAPRPATISLEGIALSAQPSWGTTASAAPTTAHHYMLGPSEFNGSAINNLITQTIKFGLQCDWHLGKSGSQYPVFPPAINPYAPEIEYVTEDLDLVRQYVNTPVEIAADGAVCKFQDETGAAGYAYSFAKCMAWGSISGSVGTLRLALIGAPTGFTAASY